ncbi:hypothetical protein [uncultured Traorella sp.]|uniref:hypothetical protein n=1 Tax=uncultured Traorella sp. TaxID=1929048 RepID=UPI0025FF0796|nr:hypothetical protein [uncultured Traorella sp.]
MIEKDTVRLLRECDAGIKMGVASIDEVLDNVSDEKFKKYLMNCKEEHIKLENEVELSLDRYQDEGKEAGVMAKTMSWMKTNARLVMDESDHTIADIMIDGCHMGIKSLNRYLNQYEAADEDSKEIAKKLIHIEEELASEMFQYL